MYKSGISIMTQVQARFIPLGTLKYKTISTPLRRECFLQTPPWHPSHDSMAHRSRWVELEEDSQTEAQRREEKAEKKRRKEEKRRAVETKQQHPTNINGVQQAQEERPAKRRKISAEPEEQNDAEGVHLLSFPSTTFAPCRDIELYEFINNIEEGSYGMVSRARSKDNGEIVALKRLKLDYANDGFPVTGLREIQTLKACRHANIVNLQEVVSSSDFKDIYLVMDFLEHDLKTLLEDISEPFLPSEIKTLMLQLVSATEYLHHNWILHRDLKTSNLLLNNRGELKIADFGMARYTSNPPPILTQLVVTLWYRSPELLLGTEEYGFEVDIWSIGCIFAELQTREPLFQGKNEVDQLSKMFGLLGTPTKESWPDFRSLPNAKALYPLLSNTKSGSSRNGIPSTHFPYLTSSGLRLLNECLSMNPERRPTATKILQHSYFREDPRPKPKEMFPTFPSKAGQEKRRRRATPQAPDRGDAPKLDARDFAGVFGGNNNEDEKGAGFSLRLG